MLVASFSVYSQTLCTDNKRAIAWFTEGENLRVRGRLQEALNLFDQALDKEPEFCEAWFRKAMVLRAMHKMDQAITALRSGLATADSPVKERSFCYELGDLLIREGQYKEALPFLDKFLTLESQNQARIADVRRWRANCLFAMSNMGSAQVHPVPLSDTVNCFYMQYFPVLTGDEKQLFFTRRVGSRPMDTEDIMWVQRDAAGRWGKPVPLSSVINTPENEGTCSVSADGRLLIFTSCQGRESLGSCDLYQSRKIGSRWTVPENLGDAVNSYAWESQPSLSADGRVLYFVSDRKGGLGGRDIYRAEKDEKGKWKKAENMGAVINTRFEEISPFIHSNGITLYFSSTGHPGFGGYDIFHTMRKDGAWSKPVNFGYPVNNFGDQYAMFITPDGQRAYYALEEGTGDERSVLMTMEIPEQLRVALPSSSVSGKITDRKTGKVLRARVELIELQTKATVSVTHSDSLDGTYIMMLNRGTEYGLFVSRPGYLFQSVHFNVDDAVREVRRDVALDPVVVGSSMVLNNIFFDYDRFDLRAESFAELDEVHQFMIQNPLLRIEISGHTDNTGTDSGNRTLSTNRARAVVNYLTSKGIDPKRLVAAGLGASRPRSSNDTDAGRADNRRIEFRILANK